MIPTIADIREAFPELDEGRCEAILRLVERADESSFARGVMHERARFAALFSMEDR